MSRDLHKQVLRLAILSGVLGVIHVVMPAIAYTGRDPIVKVGDQFARWDVVNSGLILGGMFLCVAWTLRAAATHLSTPHPVTTALLTGFAFVLAADAVYLVVDPTPAPDGMGWTSYVLAVVLGLAAADAWSASRRSRNHAT